MQKVVLHAVLGGLISKATGGDFASGAIAGGVAEGLTPLANNYLAQYVSDLFSAADLTEAGSQAKITTGQLIGLIASSMAGGSAATGSLIGGASEKYNQQGHHTGGHGEAPENADEALEELKETFDVFHPLDDHDPVGDDVEILDPVPGKGPPIVGGSSSGPKGAELPLLGTKPLGLGSTGRSTPTNLNEKLAMEQAISNPTAGRILPVPMTDARWPAAEGLVKSAQNINGIEIHYVRNSNTGAVDDFKFK